MITNEQPSWEQDTDEWNTNDLPGTTFQLEPGAVYATGFTDGSVLVAVAGTGEEISDLERGLLTGGVVGQSVADFINSLDVPQTAKIIVDLSNVEKVGSVLENALGSLIQSAACEAGRPEVVLVNPTRAVMLIDQMKQPFVTDSGRIHIATDRDNAVAGLAESQEFSSQLNNRIEEHAQTREQQKEAAYATKKVVEERVADLEINALTADIYAEPLVIVTASIGHFNGKIAGQDLIGELKSKHAGKPILLDLSNSNFITSDGSIALVSFGKLAAPKKLHVIVEEGAAIDVSIRKMHLDKLPNVELGSSKDDVLSEYLS